MKHCGFVLDIHLIKIMAIAPPPPNECIVAVHVCHILGTFFYEFLRVHTKRYIFFGNTFSPILEVQMFMCQMLCLPRKVTWFKQEICSLTEKEKGSALQIPLERGTHSALENLKIQQQTAYKAFHKDSWLGHCKYEKINEK